ncbi:hypothetical protein [Paracoccus albus]|uniref:hypothetical protein n=1 Tax=Paracoccus albus TaxID=3017784 RepID=UPI0022F0F73F|nr:hypothetical protein [Paracoccus albus]WBU60071.1 hypothetical protein PAF20_15225 [Paracoccus albus]
MTSRLSAALTMFFIAFAATPALAASDCSVTRLEEGPTFTSGPDCTFSWVQNNRLQTVMWRAVEEDFEPAKLRQSGVLQVMQASRLPELIDVDQDGWLDIVSFTLVGMVNGTFDVFFYDPDAEVFRQPPPLYGHTMARDRDGFILVAGRSGPATVISLYSLDGQSFRPRYEINPYAISPTQPDSGFACEITVLTRNGKAERKIDLESNDPAHRDMLRHYCEPEPVTREERNVWLEEDPAQVDRVPGGTLFYCRLEDSEKAVTIERVVGGLRYAFGPVGGEAELVLDRTEDEVSLPSEDATPRAGEISFVNGEYTYTAYYSQGTPDTDDVALQSDAMFPPLLTRGLRVTREGERDEPVFSRECVLEHSFDAFTAG